MPLKHLNFEQTLIHMKKQSVVLSKKLFLDKEVISNLNNNQQEIVLGGATVNCSQLTCGAEMPKSWRNRLF